MLWWRGDQERGPTAPGSCCGGELLQLQLAGSWGVLVRQHSWTACQQRCACSRMRNSARTMHSRARQTRCTANSCCMASPVWQLLQSLCCAVQLSAALLVVLLHHERYSPVAVVTAALRLPALAVARRIHRDSIGAAADDDVITTHVARYAGGRYMTVAHLLMGIVCPVTNHVGLLIAVNPTRKARHGMA